MPATKIKNVAKRKVPKDLSRVKSTKTKSFPTKFLITALVVIAVALISYKYPINSLIKSIDPIESYNLRSMSLIERELVYVKNKEENGIPKYEVWAMDIDGSGQQKLDISSAVWKAFKFPGQKEVLYIKDSDGSVNFYNIETKADRKVQLMTYPDPKVFVSIYVNTLNEVAPDYSGIVYQAEFYDDCGPPPADAYEWGPCFPEPRDDYKPGAYVYNFSTNKNIYLGQSVIVNRWDSNSTSVYYTDIGGNDQALKKINYETGEVVRINDSTSFGYSEYPLLKSNKSLVFDGSASDSDSSSQLKLVNKDSGKETLLFRGGWADIQPFVSFSPNEKVALIERQIRTRPSYPYGRLYKIDMTKSESELLPLTNNYDNISLEPFGIWVDNNNFITAARTNDEYIPHEGESDVKYDDDYIVNINVQTGEITNLTDKDVYSFN